MSINKPAKQTEIIIDIDDKPVTKVYDKASIKSFIQIKALSEVEKYIKQTCEIIQDFKGKLPKSSTCLETHFTRVHDTILIDGERGSGKSAFLLNVIDRLCMKDDVGDKKFPKLCSLGIIDPTLISGKENIFILIISRIQDVLEDWDKQTCKCTNRDSKLAKWNERLRDLASGLKMLDNIGPDTMKTWDDAQYIMHEGLHDAKSGARLERNFHKLVNEALNILEYDAFLLCFDDIDTDFAKGWPVLEIVRKYLTTPQVIVLLSGDYTLYSKLVRQKQWELFKGHNELIAHINEDHLKSEIEKLENQYLSKVLDPNRRVQIRAAWELPKELFYRVNKEENKTLLRYFFQALLEVCYQYPHASCKKISELFLHIPMRSIFHIVSAVFEQEEIKKKVLDRAVALSEMYNKHEHFGEEKYVEDSNIKSMEVIVFHAQIIHVYNDRLSSLGFNSDDIRTVQWTGQLYKLVKILKKISLLSRGANLLPSDVVIQNSLDILFMSGIFYSLFISDIKYCFEYYIRVLLFRNFIEKYKPSTNGKSEQEISDILLSEQNTLLDICRIYEDMQRSGTFNDSTIKINVLGESFTLHKSINIVKHVLCAILFKLNDTQGVCFSVHRFISLIGIVCSASDDLNLVLKKFNNFEGLDIPQPNDYYTIFDEQCNAIHLWSLQYHDDSKDKASFRLNTALPPYMHEEIFSSFILSVKTADNLNKISEIYLHAASEVESKYRAHTSFSDYMRECPLFKIIDSIDLQFTHIPNEDVPLKSENDTASPPAVTLRPQNNE